TSKFISASSFLIPCMINVLLLNLLRCLHTIQCVKISFNRFFILEYNNISVISCFKKRLKSFFHLFLTGMIGDTDELQKRIAQFFLASFSHIRPGFANMKQPALGHSVEAHNQRKFEVYNCVCL